MFDQPRKGTEAYRVKQEVEKRRKEAEEKGLPDLLIDVWFTVGLRHFPSWAKKKSEYIHPDLTDLEDLEKKNNASGIKFKMRDKTYEIVSEQENSLLGEADFTYIITIRISGKKAFSCLVREKIHYSDYGSYESYTPGIIPSYANDEWVKDFQDIKKFSKETSERKRLEYAENPERTKKMKEDFGIIDSDLTESKQDEKNKKQFDPPKSKNVDQPITKKPVWKKFWFWIVIIISYLLLIS